MAATPPSAVRSCPAANRWQVSRQTPGLRVVLNGGQVRGQVAGPRAKHLPLPGHRLEQQVGVVVAELVEQRKRDLADLPQRLLPGVASAGPAAGQPAAEPACTTTPRAPISAPRRSACATASADLAATSGLPEPRLTMYVACTKTGIPDSRSRASSPGVTWPRRPAARVGHEDLDDLGTTSAA